MVWRFSGGNEQVMKRKIARLQKDFFWSTMLANHCRQIKPTLTVGRKPEVNGYLQCQSCIDSFSTSSNLLLLWSFAAPPQHQTFSSFAPLEKPENKDLNSLHVQHIFIFRILHHCPSSFETRFLYHIQVKHIFTKNIKFMILQINSKNKPVITFFSICALHSIWLIFYLYIWASSTYTLPKLVPAALRSNYIHIGIILFYVFHMCYFCMMALPEWNK